MSKTHKDKPNKIKWPKYWNTSNSYTSNSYFPKEPKKRKECDSEWHWGSSTPSWWTHMFMIKPQRRANKLWEREVVKTPLHQLEELDKPNVSRKPHKYYW